MFTRKIAASDRVVFPMRNAKNARSVGSRCRLDKKIVHIAPPPVFSGLVTPDYWVIAGVKVLRRVLALRLVATPDMAARKAHPEMHPGRSHLQAFFAAIRSQRIDITDLIEMCALITSHFFLAFVS